MIKMQAQLQRKQFTLNVDLKLQSRVTGLFGPSGSGKSTLISMIAGLVTPENGRIEINRQCVFDSQKNINIPVHQRRIGFVFQDSRLFPHLTVEKNLLYGLKRTDVAQFNVDEITALLEINPLLKQKPHQLSGGEKQRVAIGRALLSNPQLLLLDEPLASLDEALKKQILPFLKKVTEEINTPMIYISHALEEVQQITNNIVLINNGEIKD